MKYRNLITSGDAKTSKGEKLGVRTGILYLAPADESKVINVCQFASPGCKATCLFTAGRGVFGSVREARVNKTLYYVQNPVLFMENLEHDVRKLVKYGKKNDIEVAVRINGTSDMPKLALPLVEKFPETQFYDYTKLPKPWQRVKENYHLTFSRSELNESECRDALANGVNVAVVFSTKRGQALPDEFWGYEVIDGDEHDLRFRDPKGVVVGLRAKGLARKDNSFGFVVQV